MVSVDQQHINTIPPRSVVFPMLGGRVICPGQFSEKSRTET